MQQLRLWTHMKLLSLEPESFRVTACGSQNSSLVIHFAELWPLRHPHLASSPAGSASATMLPIPPQQKTQQPFDCWALVRMTGLEPTWNCFHWNLNPARLPIPPHPHIKLVSADYSACAWLLRCPKFIACHMLRWISTAAPSSSRFILHRRRFDDDAANSATSAY